MTKENKKALTAVAEKIAEAKKELRCIALEEARRGKRELPESMEHAEASLEMMAAYVKIDAATDALNRALELADFETRTKISAANSQERRKLAEKMFEKVMELEKERRDRNR